MGSKSVEELLQNSTGVHFSGFHVDDSKRRISEEKFEAASATENGYKEPFVIG